VFWFFSSLGWASLSCWRHYICFWGNGQWWILLCKYYNSVYTMHVFFIFCKDRELKNECFIDPGGSTWLSRSCAIKLLATTALGLKKMSNHKSRTEEWPQIVTITHFTEFSSKTILAFCFSGHFFYIKCLFSCNVLYMTLCLLLIALLPLLHSTFSLHVY